MTKQEETLCCGCGGEFKVYETSYIDKYGEHPDGVLKANCNKCGIGFDPVTCNRFRTPQEAIEAFKTATGHPSQGCDVDHLYEPDKGETK